MSLAQLTLEDVVNAERGVLDLHAIRLSYIYGDEAVERMVSLPAGGLQVFRDGRWRADETGIARPIYDLGYCHAASAFNYAWLGILRAGLHATDLNSDLVTLSQFLKPSPVLDTYDSEEFAYASFKGLRSDEILIALASAVHARFAIEEGYDIPLEGVAALARVSDKTIRTAANPRLPDALKTVKAGNRTFVQPEDALEWLLRRPDFKPTQPRSESTEEYRGDASQLATFLAERRRRLTVSEFTAALKSAGFSNSDWQALETERMDPSAVRVDGLTLLALGKELSLQSPRAFAVWVLELALNARRTSAEFSHQAELARLNQVLAEALPIEGTKK